ncbi:ornithine cyclodeaminase family protein [Steroidobacter cummioxidans]|uniref:ornithine cyclodeaminase family protein n=1 Tax=Steroidobacter cummioxidans TaxID=1803913 RepID=UPI000E316BBB|nr:ornithine cyclodeaminase family protein [Steroidobacter cummioxidans]
MTDSVPLIDAATVERLSPMPELIATLRAAFENGGYQSPPRYAHDMSKTSSLLLMPSWNESSRLGVKIVNVDRVARPSVRSSYVLMDRATARPLAVLDGATLTRRRTAAASVLAATFLARPDSRRLLLLGTGAMIPALIEAYASAFPIETILIWGRDPQNAATAAAQARASNFKAEAVTDVRAALSSADIVSSATLATSPLIHGADLREGMHVDLIGAFRPEMCEADGVCFSRARVFVDTYAGAMEEAGDLLQAIDGGHIRADDIAADLTALCQKKHAGRGTDRDAITLFKSVGAALEDLAAAELVFEKWQQN